MLRKSLKWAGVGAVLGLLCSLAIVWSPRSSSTVRVADSSAAGYSDADVAIEYPEVRGAERPGSTSTGYSDQAKVNVPDLRVIEIVRQKILLGNVVEALSAAGLIVHDEQRVEALHELTEVVFPQQTSQLIAWNARPNQKLEVEMLHDLIANIHADNYRAYYLGLLAARTGTFLAVPNEPLPSVSPRYESSLLPSFPYLGRKSQIEVPRTLPSFSSDAAYAILHRIVERDAKAIHDKQNRSALLLQVWDALSKSSNSNHSGLAARALQQAREAKQQADKLVAATSRLPTSHSPATHATTHDANGHAGGFVFAFTGFAALIGSLFHMVGHGLYEVGHGLILGLGHFLSHTAFDRFKDLGERRNHGETSGKDAGGTLQKESAESHPAPANVASTSTNGKLATVI